MGCFQLVSLTDTTDFTKFIHSFSLQVYILLIRSHPSGYKTYLNFVSFLSLITLDVHDQYTIGMFHILDIFHASENK